MGHTVCRYCKEKPRRGEAPLTGELCWGTLHARGHVCCTGPVRHSHQGECLWQEGVPHQIEHACTHSGGGGQVEDTAAAPEIQQAGELGERILRASRCAVSRNEEVGDHRLEHGGHIWLLRWLFIVAAAHLRQSPADMHDIESWKSPVSWCMAGQAMHVFI